MNSERIESLLTQLIQKVGVIQTDMLDMKQEIGGMKQDIFEMKQEIGGMKQEICGLKQEMQEQKQETQGIKQEIQGIKQTLIEIETKGDARHKEMMERLKKIEIDQDFIWEKTVKNEREISIIKGQLSQ